MNGTVISVKPIQPLNTPSPKVTTESGTVNCWNLIQFMNAYASIVSSCEFSPNVTVVNEVLLANVYSFIVLIESPNVTVVKNESFSNKCLAVVVVLTVAWKILVQFANA